MNTQGERMLVHHAVRLICSINKYYQYLPAGGFYDTFMNKAMGVKEIDLYVKFMDDQPFRTNLSFTGSSNTNRNCRTTAFTSPKFGGSPGEKEIYINRDAANPSTIVHELFHFFTHADFTNGVPPQLNEAVTEYFTRKTLQKKEAFGGEQKKNFADFQLGDRKNRYDTHHMMLGFGRAGAATKADKPKDYMKKAYFRGDADAIRFINQNMGELEEMLAV